MDISINGRPADIVPDTEKTLGEVLAGLEQWFGGTGYRLSGLRVNGEAIGSSGMDEAFRRDLGEIRTLEIKASSWPELALEALEGAEAFLEAWGDAGFEGRSRLREDWEESAAAHFLAAEIPDLFSLIGGAFRGEESTPAEISFLVGERRREIISPGEEISRMENLASAVAGRLEELPLDVQTGKDGRAAETIRLFSHVAEKLFRLFSLLKMAGFPGAEPPVEDRPAREFIGEFGAALKELLAAYEARDVVLVGDLAEYELAPRLRKLYGAIKAAVSG
jgi:hypothetical protein